MGAALQTAAMVILNAISQISHIHSTFSFLSLDVMHFSMQVLMETDLTEGPTKRWSQSFLINCINMKSYLRGEQSHLMDPCN